LALRHRQDAGRPDPERDERDVPEREHAGVADEEVERDDDRHLHERVEEVVLERGGDAEPEQGGRQHERRRAQQLGDASQGHARSTAAPPRVKRPFGRRSRTRITAPKRKLGRYWLWFVGSAPPRIPLAKPIVKPPSVAGIGRVSPPRTTPASTTIVSSSPKMGVTCGLRPVSMKAETAASSPEMRTAPVTTRFARTPSSRDVVKSIAAARMCSPSDVRVSNSWSSTRQNAAIAIETIAILRISTPPMSHGWFSGPIEEAIVPSWPKAS